MRIFLRDIDGNKLVDFESDCVPRNGDTVVQPRTFVSYIVASAKYIPSTYGNSMTVSLLVTPLQDTQH